MTSGAMASADAGVQGFACTSHHPDDHRERHRSSHNRDGLAQTRPWPSPSTATSPCCASRRDGARRALVVIRIAGASQADRIRSGDQESESGDLQKF
jgi:hypothetical protein